MRSTKENKGNEGIGEGCRTLQSTEERRRDRDRSRKPTVDKRKEER